MRQSVSRYLLQVVFVACICPAVLSQESTENSSVLFHHITPDQSFGMGNTWAILEDHEGFIWFGTEDGLLKYDGYELISYKQSNAGVNSIIGNIIVCIFEDSRHNLWIGSFGSGLNLYKRNENRFYNFTINAENPNSLPFNGVKSIIEDKQGVLWFATEGGGLASLHVDSVDTHLPNLKFKRWRHDPNNPNSLSENFLRSLTQDKKGNIYVASYGGGVTIIDPQRKNFTHLLHEEGNENSLSENTIFKVFVDSKQRVWIGTQNSGVDLYLPEEKKFIHYKVSSDPYSLHHNEVETIIEDQSGTIWVGTDNGLSRLLDSNDPIPEGKFETFHHEPQNGFSILSNSIKSAYVDSHNSLWVGSYYGGVNVYNKDHFKFIPLRNKPWKKNSLESNNVTAFVEDDKGNIWIGTDGGGVHVLTNAHDNLHHDTYKKIELINPYTKKVQNKIKSLALDHTGNLWVGTWASGMFKYNIASGNYTYFGLDDNDPSFDGYSVLTMQIDRNNNLWCGTLMDGVSVYNQKKNSFTTYTSVPNNPYHFTANRINCIYIDSKQRVWIGGDVGGLNLYHEEVNTFEHILYKTIITDKVSILSLRESTDGKLWVGTVSGVIVYDPESKTAVSYNEKNGLYDNVIHAMLQADDGNMWLSTNQGLVVFDEELGTIAGFSKQDGLQGNQFNNNSAYRSARGLMLFGGTNGWNAFYSPDIRKSDQQLPIAFTRFWVNGELVDINSPGSMLKEPINSVTTVDLNHDQNSFSIEFALLEYNFSERSHYAYMLQGFNTKWQEIETDRKVTFTNLFPGEYTLRIRASNKDGFWREREKSLKIIVLPSWYQTLWFKLGLAVLLVGTIYTFYRIRIRLLIAQKKKLENLVNVRTLALSNSNEMLKSKITEINSINELLSRQRNEIVEKNNEILSQNEELTSQNEQIVHQQKSLQNAQLRLKEINEKLEKLVDERTSELQSTIKKLNKTVNELDRFIYSASHDLSAPLKSVRGLVQLAKMEQEPARLLEYYQFINESILKLETVIENLVEYSKNVHVGATVAPFNLNELVQEVISEIAFWPDASKIKFQIYLNQDQVVCSDRHRLKVVLHNLFSNGIKYADFRKEESTIQVSYSEHGQAWELKVCDNGIGIDPMYIDKVFNMYFRATDKSKGSGLGLFIVKEIIDRLGGDIRVSSTKGIETCFNITLPKK